MSAFLPAFGATFEAIAGIFLVILAAGVLLRRGVIRQDHVTALSEVTVTVLLPCLIFAKVVATLDPGAVPLWWALPLLGVAMPAVGLVLALGAFAGRWRGREAMLAVASLQNAGYLVLPVGLALFPQSFDRFALYCFLFILGYNPLLWSIGRVLSSGTPQGPRPWMAVLNPPLVSNLAAVVVVLTGAARFLPDPLMDAVGLLGEGAVPAATFILGAVLGGIRLRPGRYLGDLVRVLAVKLALLPAVTILVLLAVGPERLDPLLTRFLVIEAAAAPAVGLVLMVRTWGGDEERMGTAMLASYLGCLLALPLWVALWDVLLSS